MNKKQIIGSMTAKGGFANELDISLKFNNFKCDIDAQEWLEIMGYNWHKITNLVSLMIPPRISKKTAIELGINEDGFPFKEMVELQIQPAYNLK